LAVGLVRRPYVGESVGKSRPVQYVKIEGSMFDGFHQSLSLFRVVRSLVFVTSVQYIKGIGWYPCSQMYTDTTDLQVWMGSFTGACGASCNKRRKEEKHICMCVKNSRFCAPVPRKGNMIFSNGIPPHLYGLDLEKYYYIKTAGRCDGFKFDHAWLAICRWRVQIGFN